MAQSCTPPTFFDTQQQVDDFPTQYPDCTEIIGTVFIAGNEITNLNGLRNITSIRSELFIGSPSLLSLEGLENLTSVGSDLTLESCNSLKNLSGLENLTSIGGHLVIAHNDSLINPSGLQNLTSIGDEIRIQKNDNLINLSGLQNITAVSEYLEVRQNKNLINLAGLEALTSIEGDLIVNFNDNLIDLSALDGVTSVGGQLVIGFNTSLPNLSGLEALTSIAGKLTISYNDNLTNLSGLQNITSIGDYVKIVYNPMLNACSIFSVCNHIANGDSTVVIANATGCNSIDEIVDNCDSIGKIYHPIFYDINENGTQESGEPFHPSASVAIEPGNIISYGNALNGGFSYQYFGDYTIAYHPLTTTDWVLTTDSVYTISLSASSLEKTVFFGITPTTLYSEAEPSMSVGNFRCNTFQTIHSYGENTGTSIIDGTLWIEIDSNILSVEYLDTPDTVVAPNLYGWHFKDWIPGAVIHKKIKLEIPGPLDFPLGESLDFQTYITYSDMNGEYTSPPFEYSDIVECSYDPNDKLVNPVYPFNYALIREPLTYTIRFQNTGNAEAYDVVIRDTLHPLLNPATFQVIGSSHDSILNTQLRDNKHLSFSFININLPDSTSNFEGSQGFVMYRIEAYDSIPNGSEITNTAGIYFDLNPPVITNTTKNTMLYTFDADEDGFDLFEDCNDNDDMINPDSEEVCDGIDNNCNDLTDEDLPLFTYYPDEDMDGFGTPNDSMMSCLMTAPNGFVNNQLDCDDNNDTINPNATEIPDNGIDENCDDEDLITSIQENSIEREITIFPNPTSGTVSINCSIETSGKFSLLDNTGRTILTQNLKQKNEIDLVNLPSGVYLLEIKTVNGDWTEKLIKI
ncbi:MAG: T9SS type A sorting domain-containing protein [Bacteroidota bacterium]